jgi:hypothetical protein
MYIKTEQQKPRTATVSRQMLVRTWDRDTDQDGTPMVEEFIPEFDIKVKVRNEKPTDRNYYTTMAASLLGKAMGLKSFWRTIDEGKFPPIDEIIDEFEEVQKAQSQAQSQALMSQMQQEAQDRQIDR